MIYTLAHTLLAIPISMMLIERKYGPRQNQSLVVISGALCFIDKVLFVLKSNGASWRSFFAKILHDMGYVPIKADPDVWLKPAFKPDGNDY
mmetsp:Transcript_24639/g.23662  ORF Transcript_24639/g.23662 Transcript_24639/m.23662 type:complete len:91 (+) Transcript_24639:69-341(+)